MRLAVVNLTSGGFSGGYRKYLDRLMPRLRRHPAVERLDVFIPPQVAAGADHTWPVRDALGGYRELRQQIRELRPDVVFIPTARWFDATGTPTVVMVRNMEPIEVPFGGNAWPEAVKNLVRAHTARRACLRADRVIAVSEHVRDFLRTRWDIDERRVGVVYHGIDAPVAGEEQRPALLAALEGRPFFFTAGSIRPARGLETLISAMALDAGGRDRLLVIAGKVDPGAEAYARRLADLAERAGVAQRIIRVGHISPAEMSWSFRNCELFIMTTRAEACPNTALEAMSHGVLAISGDNAPMPEFFGQAARYYHLGEASSLAATIRETLALPDREMKALRARALARAKDFDWDRTADETIRQLGLAMK
jgi:glycosyltransferase involved in cell wall biosynthesis